MVVLRFALTTIVGGFLVKSGGVVPVGKSNLLVALVGSLNQRRQFEPKNSKASKKATR